MADAIRVSLEMESLRELVRDLGDRVAHVDLTPAMKAAMLHQQSSVIARVRRYGVNADGVGLAPLTDRYRRRKAKAVGGLPIGVLSGRFIRSLSSGREQIAEANAKGFRYGSMVPYAGYFVDGTSKQKARDVISFSDVDLVKIEVILLEHVVKVLAGEMV